MYELLETYLPPLLGVSAAAYAVLAAKVARSTPQNPNNVVSIFLFLVAGMVAGLSEGETPEDSLRLAVACAAADATTCAAGDVALEVVERFNKQAVVEEVDVQPSSPRPKKRKNRRR